ncbi:hypothetical protein SAY87_031921 [Trapa incisa]|uniref:Protein DETOXIFICATION n=1 Tax=Trapa incisa TaxID=236973 RepID=A0AAN7KU55_9MYRT|nr:hypothetical protein SAY87_031921 [Trapa incisa]
MPPPTSWTPETGDQPNERSSGGLVAITVSELKLQREIAVPLVAMNLAWFAKLTITTLFLGRLGKLHLAGGTLGFTFANVTGFSVLNGLCGSMEPICGQAYGAKNFKLLRKTLLMTVLLLLAVSALISFLWLYVDKILIAFGQQKEIAAVARSYLLYLLPDLAVTSFLCPLKAYLSTQGITVPTMLASWLALAVHVPVNILLVKTMGIKGVSTAVWATDLIVVVVLGLYVAVMEINRRSKEVEEEWRGPTATGHWHWGLQDWARLLKLSGPCCLTTCLEWWCYEILVLLTGNLRDAERTVGALAIVLNFDYLLFSVMLSLSTCASIRVSNSLGANRAVEARRSAHISAGLGVVTGLVGASIMVSARGVWGQLFSHDKGTIDCVKRMLLLMAAIEVVNFPLQVCGGILRGTARPWLAMYASLGGFYLVALPLGVVLAFRVRLGLGGLLAGFLVGTFVCLGLLTVFVAGINWDKEADKAQALASNGDAVGADIDNPNRPKIEAAT